MTWTAPRTWVTGEVVTSTIMNTHIRDNLIAILPVGSYIYRAAVGSAVETAVEGRWLEANGVAVSRTTYSALSTYLAALTPTYPFGAGNGTSTFNLPDMRGRVPVSQSPSGAADVADLGDNDGVAQNLRNIRHVHAYSVVSHQINLGSSGGGNPYDQIAGALTSGDSNNSDRPAYLVGGIWFIKYTS